MTGVYVSSRDSLFAMDRTDAIADYYQRASALSIQEAKKKGKYAFLIETLFRNMLPLCLGGIFTAMGVCVMHYIGMVAMEFDGHIVWNQGIIAASVLIALIASIAAYWILFRVLVVFPNVEALRLVCAVLAAVAVNGMHYTGMAAATFVYTDKTTIIEDSPNLVPQNQAMVGAVVAGILMSFFALALAINDLRGWLFSTARVMKELDMQAIDPHNTTDKGESFLNTYKTLREKSKSGKHSKNNKKIIQLRLSRPKSASDFRSDCPDESGIGDSIGQSQTRIPSSNQKYSPSPSSSGHPISQVVPVEDDNKDMIISNRVFHKRNLPTDQALPASTGVNVV
jgi:NO-binding membrane sensor protein with MHYT domain